MAGKYRACMQLEWTGTKEPLSDGADSRFHKATLWVLLFEEKWNKKTAKNISPELLASFGRQLTKTEDIKVELHNAVLNWLHFSKEGEACQEENTNLYTFFS